MSLSSSLNAAVAGLTLTSRRAEIVATNVANADRDGYARRDLRAAGVGSAITRIDTVVERQIDPNLRHLRREYQGRQSGLAADQTFHTSLDAGIGDPDQPGSLQARVAALDAALTTAAANPASDQAIQAISQAAQDVVSKVNGLADTVIRERQQADTEIGMAVEGLNADLKGIERLNAEIVRLRATSHDTADLEDERAILIDRVSSQIPVYELPRDHGTVALVSHGGSILLDGRAAEFSFTPRAPITPDMVVPIQLSGLTLNGRDIATSGPTSTINGGRLQALFQVRDETAPAAMERLDAFAAELITRFENPAFDPSLTAGQPGMFTDLGSAYDPTAPAGLADRLRLNGLVSPTNPSTLWHLRDGLGAAVPGNVAENAQILRFSEALDTRQAPANGAITQVPTTIAELAGHLKSAVSSDRLGAENRYAESARQADRLVDQRDGGAVDVDAEMRRLLDIEQAYAANARIIQVVGDMMDRLTEL
ncbi:MAG: flagellar basal body rod C-terminal domain-containing protein [Pseudomonadota bacterium]